MSSKRFVLAAAVVIVTASAWAPDALAQRRVVRGHARPLVAARVGVGYGYPFFYSPFYPAFSYAPFYSPFFGGWYPAWGYPPYGYGFYGRAPIAEARLQMKPRDADVYVDGYYVGRVDDFDGIFQRLDLPPGEHEITVYHEGYRTHRYKNLFRPGAGYKVQASLEPLAQGEAQEPRPQAPPRAADHQPAGPAGGYPHGPERGRTVPLPERRGADREEASGFGTLAIRVQPADAAVRIDGERWDSPEGGSRLLVELVPGRHRIEVQKDGFKSYSTSIEIRAGETQSVNVSLPRDGGI